MFWLRSKKMFFVCTLHKSTEALFKKVLNTLCGLSSCLAQKRSIKVYTFNNPKRIRVTDQFVSLMFQSEQKTIQIYFIYAL